jgi:hypothetical protein
LDGGGFVCESWGRWEVGGWYGGCLRDGNVGIYCSDVDGWGYHV